MWTTRLFILLTFASALYAAEKRKEAAEDSKTLIMLELESVTNDDRHKRSSLESARGIRQAPQVPQDYLSLLQQLAAQRNEPPNQQHLIQQFVVAPDGQQPQAIRYVLAPDGRLLEQQDPSVHPQFLGQQPQPAPQPQPTAQPAPARKAPLVPPELAAFARFQQQALQEYRNGAIREQVQQGPGPRPRTRPPRPNPTQVGPQVFSHAASQAAQRHQERLQASLNSQGGFQPIVDPQILLQQQLSQLAAGQPQPSQATSVPPQFADYFQPQAQLQQLQPQFQAQLQQESQPQLQARPQLFQPAQQPEPQPQLVYRPQPQPQFLAPQGRPSSQAQLQPEQYLIETTATPSPAPRPQYIQLPQQQAERAGPVPQPQHQFQYIDLRTGQPIPAPQPQFIYTREEQPQEPEPTPASTLLQPTPGRGLFSPRLPSPRPPTSASPSRSAIFVSRASTPKPTATVEEFVQPRPEERVPVIRLPSPSGQRPLTQTELEALIGAGFSVSPVQQPLPDDSLFAKSKRQQPRLQHKNHVVYQNQQEGVQYQYSPGSSAAETSQKPKQVVYAPQEGRKRYQKKKPAQFVYTNEDSVRNLYKVEGRSAAPGSKDVVTYVLALDTNQPTEATQVEKRTVQNSTQ